MYIICHIHTDSCQDTADIELIPEGEDTQPDSPLEDTVSVTLKRENSIRRSQRHGRLEQQWQQNRETACVFVSECNVGAVGF